MFGRKPTFLYSLFFVALFGGLSAFAPTYMTLCLLIFLTGCGIGGNIVVDSCLFMEFLPQARRSLAGFLVIFYSIGGVLASLISIGVFHVLPDCTGGDDWMQCKGWGWRVVLLISSGFALLFLAIRIFLFEVEESPYYSLMKRNLPQLFDTLNHILMANKHPIGSIELPKVVDMIKEYDEYIRGEEVFLSTCNPEEANIPDSSPNNMMETDIGFFKRFITVFSGWISCLSVLKGRMLVNTILLGIVWILVNLGFTMYENKTKFAFLMFILGLVHL